MRTFTAAKTWLLLLVCAFISRALAKGQDTHTRKWTQRDGVSISEVNVLLPFPTRESVTTFPLGVAGGCFDWYPANLFSLFLFSLSFFFFFSLFLFLSLSLSFLNSQEKHFLHFPPLQVNVILSFSGILPTIVF